MTDLRQSARRSPGRLGAPSAGAIDRQRVKTTPQSQDVGRDRHQKSQGHTRHLVVDTLWLIVAGVVPAAHVDAQEGGPGALLISSCADGVTRLRQLWEHGGDRTAWLHAWGELKAHVSA